MNVAIIDYNAGNICSVVNALKRLGVEAVVTADKEAISRADKVIFPGQGEATQTMQYLRAHRLDELIISLKQPVLGICIGMQLLCRFSEEGNVDCLGIFDVPVQRFQPQQHADKVPHIGWNTLTGLKGELYKGINEGEFVYFVHSYYVPTNANAIATTDYIQPFCSSLQKDNFYATQFHPEKSGKVGAQILTNFINLHNK
ncbi:imidazole glycerol phosphate synthase amidotransferase subunit [Candidatus Symbiothrix dinenymphae]|nr:imidazole glycerol phosphate synthase amidotransferase subunit [Candidatus Symbiothrix dinenymphae]